MKRVFMVVGATLLVAFTADVSRAYTEAPASAYVMCKHRKAGKRGHLIMRPAHCKKNEVLITPEDYPQFVGPQGETGLTGPMGPQGLAGLIGPVGPAGEMGPRGEVGETGLTGPMGPMGPAGEVGAAGPVGPQGVQGEVGPIGPAGAPGEVGPAGPMGPTGEIGPMGPAGEAGAVGPAGPAGPKGDTGEVGPIGPMGATGENGPMGPTGPKGDSIVGPAGPRGPEGPQGEVGPTGPAGAAGEPGAPGSALAARVVDTPPNLNPQVAVGAAGTTVVVESVVLPVVTYRVTFNSPLCPDTGCDVSACVYMATFQGVVSKSGNPHRAASSLVVDAAADDVASVDVDVDMTNVLTVVFSLEALCP
jgi:Collagen triple helix repeat (20 copies)